MVEMTLTARDGGGNATESKTRVPDARAAVHQATGAGAGRAAPHLILAPDESGGVAADARCDPHLSRGPDRRSGTHIAIATA
jgi:hypothetical protein